MDGDRARIAEDFANVVEQEPEIPILPITSVTKRSQYVEAAFPAWAQVDDKTTTIAVTFHDERAVDAAPSQE